MGLNLTIYAVSENTVHMIGGTKRDDLYDAFLTWDAKLDYIDSRLKEAAEDWGEDTENILSARDALKHLIFDTEMDKGQSEVYCFVVEMICEVVATETFTDWYGPHVLNTFEWVDKEAKKYRKTLDAFNLVYSDNPFKIPDNYDINIGYWSHRRCRKNLKILKKMIKKGPKTSEFADVDSYHALEDMLKWVETTLKNEKDGGLMGIMF